MGHFTQVIYLVIFALLSRAECSTGRFGESFPYGTAVGDRDVQIPLDRYYYMYLRTSFSLYGSSERYFYVNENGVLSFRSRFSSTIIRKFESFSRSTPLIAPFWTDLDQRFGGRILFRVTSSISTLEHARNLTQQQFPDLDFEPTDAVIVTWLEIRHGFRRSVNTFQVALVYNSVMSFAYFFYNETVTGLRISNAGFAPSTSSGSNGESFTIPGVFSSFANLASGSNTDVPGFYAFRVDLSIIVQPGDIIARLEQNSYSTSEADGQLEICVLVEGRPLNRSVSLHLISSDNHSAEVGSDYGRVNIHLFFGHGAGNRQCLNITIMDDLILEGEECFILVLRSDSAEVINRNASVSIRDNDVGRFGESFPFGPTSGDSDYRNSLRFNNSRSTFLLSSFSFYGYRQSWFYIQENGVLSIRSSFRSTSIREFDSFSLYASLIAPFWTDLDLNRFGGSVFFRRTRNITTLERARILIHQQFPSYNFVPTDAVIVTWYKVGHQILGRNEFDVNTLQVALIYNAGMSFSFFFYNETVMGLRSAIAGFAPSRYDLNGESFMIPGVFTSTTDLTSGSNTGVPGFYAFRVDLSIIVQPEDIIARLEQSSYSTNESVGQLVICVLVEGRPSNRSVSLHLMSSDNHSAEVGSDYGRVNVRLFFGHGSGTHQCLNITIMDDSVLEGEESFLLVLRSDSAEVTTRNASVSIQDNDVGRFGESFPFGPTSGDSDYRNSLRFNNSRSTFLLSSFSFYGYRQSWFYIQENGVLSIRSSFRSTSIREFDSFTLYPSLIAPFWTDLDLNRFGGSVFFRRTRNITTLERARILIHQQFPSYNFVPTDAVIVTWYKVGHQILGRNELDVNTFQVALIYNAGMSFAFFFYNETVMGLRSAIAGFAPSRYDLNGESFMIPGVFTSTTDLTSGSNTGVPGFYAFRVDLSFIAQPREIVARLEQSSYSTNESVGQLVICVLVEERPSNRSVTLYLFSSDNHSAEVGSDYGGVNTSLLFDQGSVGRQCLNITIMDDSVLEGEESFILVLRSDSAEVTTRNASVSIQDNDVGRFGESFPFGPSSGDSDYRNSLRFNNSRYTSLFSSFSFYGYRRSYLYIQENGVLSIRSSFRSTSIREFDSFTRSVSLIAPFWTDLDLNRFGGNVFFRRTRNITTLERARILMHQQFPSYNFIPTDAVIVTWYKVGHQILGRNEFDVNTFQVALIYNAGMSFAFFFYNETVMGLRSAIAGFAPSRYDLSGESFMIPGVFTSTTDLTGGSNTGVPGFYAFRVDLSFIAQPREIVARLEQSSYSTNESVGQLVICVLVEERPSNRSVTLYLFSSDNHSAEVGSDYGGVNTSLLFDQGSVGRQCLNITIMDDSVLEGEESFILVLRSDSAEVTTRNASVSIQDNDVGRFGESFPFGPSSGDSDYRNSLRFNNSRYTSLFSSFSFYGYRRSWFYIQENGVLSIRSSFRSTSIREFDSFTRSVSLIAPFWTDLHLNRFGGSVFFRRTRNITTLERARILIHQQFPSYNFVPTDAVIVTWYKVGHQILGRNEFDVNTFQVALIYNAGMSFAFFFYNETVMGLRSAIAGFAPSRYDLSGESFMIPGVFTSTTDLTSGSNTGVPGFYAFRVDLSFIAQPREIVARLEQSSYSTNESVGQLVICVLVEGRPSNRSVTLYLFSSDNHSAEVGSDYGGVNTSLLFDQGSVGRQCLNITIMDDSVLEGEESFILVLRSDSAEVTTRNASVSIQDNDVGRFGESFPFGPTSGDSDYRNSLRFNNSRSIYFSFSFYGSRQSWFYIQENGVLSIRSSFRSTSIREFDSFTRSVSLIAPFWTDLDLNRFGGNVFFRRTRNITTLERARILIHQQFPSYNFVPTDAVIVTWYKVGHQILGRNEFDVNTFQVALIYNAGMSFAFFFYNETVMGLRSAITGFAPSRYDLSGESFMIPGVFTSTTDLTGGSNTGVPGFYAFRVDLSFIAQPGEIVARLEQSSYSTNESVGQLVICVLVEGRPSNRSVSLHLMSSDNHSAEVGSDYGRVNVCLFFGHGSGNRQCLNIIIMDDSVLEGEESFLLVLLSDSAEVTTRNASVSIRDNDVGRFGESFPFGPSSGDSDYRNSLRFNNSRSTFLLSSFSFYGYRQSWFYIQENGILSIRSSFRSTSIQEFDSFTRSVSLIAPFWTDLDLNRFGGSVFFRRTRNITTLERARILIHQQFPSYNFVPTDAVIVTWYKVGHQILGRNEFDVNTFQVALIYNAGISFAFFFYNETVMGLRSAIAGFAPSTSSGRNGGSLTIPGVFTNTTDLTSGSNTDVPGSYAFRVDLSIIVQPGDIIARLELSSYSINESVGQLVICVLVEGRPSNRSVTLHVMSLDNSAEVGLDYRRVNVRLMFDQGSVSRQCLNVTIMDDSVLEGEESFILVLQSESAGVTTRNASVSIQDNDVGRFGESFPFGPTSGDIDYRNSLRFDNSRSISLFSSFSFYRYRQSYLYIEENGIISIRGSFRSNSIREFDSFTRTRSLIAPFWTDLDLNRFGGSVFFRRTRNITTLERARILIHQQFPSYNFVPTDAVIVTWYKVGHRFLGRDVNTFQVALIYNTEMSFTFFFYNETVMGLRSAIAGFAPSRYDLNGGSFMIPGVFTNTTDLTSGSNTGVPGFYAFHVDLSFIVQPGEIIARLEQSSYSTNESVGQLVICVLVEGRPSNRSVALQIMSLDNHSAEANLDYGQVNMRLSFGQGSGSRQCLNITIIDDSVLEGEESFLLVLRSDSAEVTTRNASVSIQDNDVGRFRESFPFGLAAGDTDYTNSLHSNRILYTPYTFFFYGSRRSYLYVEENGILSNGYFGRSNVLEFDSFTHSASLIAPFWTDLDLNRFGGSIYLRRTMNSSILEQTRILMHQQFPSYNFIPTDALIVTWYKVGHRILGGNESDVNTFQVVLVYNAGISFAFFFYNETVMGLRSAIVGFAPSRYDLNGESFMIPGVFTNTTDLTSGSNTGVPGFYAFRVDLSFIVQPGDIIARLEQSSYSTNESVGQLEICVLVEGRLYNRSVALHLISSDNHSAEVGSDYGEVNMYLMFDHGSSSRQCLNITIMDDSVFEGEESFLLVLQSDSAGVTTRNASVSIQDNDVGRFGESFPFGQASGDTDYRNSLLFGNSLYRSLSSSFYFFYGYRSSYLYIEKNGMLSIRSSFRSNSIREFDSFTRYGSLIAPFWTDLDLNRFGGGVFYRRTRNVTTLERARILIHQQFPSYNFVPTDVLIVTWYQVGHRILGRNATDVNTFQVALVYNARTSFVFFFYNETVMGTRSAIAGFAPSRYDLNGKSFVIPGVFTNSTDLTSGSNTGVPGFYAFRVDLSIIVQPGDIIARLEQSSYSTNESDGQLVVCVLVEGRPSSRSVALQLMSSDNNSAEVGLDYRRVNMRLMFDQGSVSRQCLNIAIMDDSVLEGEESFLLVLQSESAGVTTRNASVSIQDNDVGRFGESFPFGPPSGDTDYANSLRFNSRRFASFQSSFSFYGFQKSWFYIEENGVLSIQSSFGSTSIREFDSFTHSASLIAPFWTDLDLNRFGGGVFYRKTRYFTTLERARILIQQHFPSYNYFLPTDAVVVTWYKVGHRVLGRNESDVNTFQVALIYNARLSFVFFFYDETVMGLRSAIAGFAPSRYDLNGESFIIPGVFTNTIDLTSGSNTGVPGFFAFRVDLSVITQPEAHTESMTRAATTQTPDTTVPDVTTRPPVTTAPYINTPEPVTTRTATIQTPDTTVPDVTTRAPVTTAPSTTAPVTDTPEPVTTRAVTTQTTTVPITRAPATHTPSTTADTVTTRTAITQTPDTSVPDVITRAPVTTAPSTTAPVTDTPEPVTTRAVTSQTTTVPDVTTRALATHTPSATADTVTTRTATTQTPDTTVPDVTTRAPVTTTPSATVDTVTTRAATTQTPDTSVPDVTTRAPVTTAPEANAPETPAPETAVPQTITTVHSTSMPDSSSSFSVTISSSPIDSHYFSDLRLNLTCHVEFLMPRDYGISVSLQWKKSDTILTSNSRVSVDEEAFEVGSLLYQSSLVFNSLDETRGDNGNYTCSATVGPINVPHLHPVTVTASHTVIVETSLFQLRLTGIENCQSWKANNPADKNEDIVTAITQNIASRCGCGFSMDRIRKEGFQCFPSSPDAVTYRAELHGTLDTTVHDMIEYIGAWLSSDASISVQLQRLTIDSTCSVTIGSFDESECKATVSVTGDRESSDTTVVGISIGGVAAVVVVLIIGAAAVIIYLRFKNFHATFKTTNNEDAGNVQMSILNLNSVNTEEQHDYEDLTKYNEAFSPQVPAEQSSLPASSAHGGDFEFINCLAYNVPVTTVGQHFIDGKEEEQYEEICEDHL